MKCEHGVTAGGNNIPQGGWNGPVGHCSCCLGHFTYLESGGWSSAGPTQGRYWYPHDKCGSCGGRYYETETACKHDLRGRVRDGLFTI